MKTLVVEVYLGSGNTYDSMKTALIKEVENGHTVVTKEFKKSIKEMTDFIIENYKSLYFDKLIIDRAGAGLALIDSLIGELKNHGYEYTPKTGEIKEIPKVYTNKEKEDMLMQMLSDVNRQSDILSVITFKSGVETRLLEDLRKKKDSLEQLLLTL